MISDKANLKSDLFNILNMVDKVDITESDLNEFKSKMKEIEKKVKEKNKPKTITISGKDHSIIKQHCTKLNLNIGEWVSEVLLREINGSSCIEIINEDNYNEVREKDEEDLLEKYSFKKQGFLFKSNRLLMNNDFKIAGYSIIDGLPIYIFDGDLEKLDEKYNFQEIGLELKKIKRSELMEKTPSFIDFNIDFLILN